jgi:hypothetical protein
MGINKMDLTKKGIIVKHILCAHLNNISFAPYKDNL